MSAAREFVGLRSPRHGWGQYAGLLGNDPWADKTLESATAPGDYEGGEGWVISPTN